jgi:hypothetical protein
MTDTEAQVLLLGQAWAEAERHGDADPDSRVASRARLSA